MSATAYARPQSLFETAWLADHLLDPAIAIVEVDVDTAAYGAGHILGAIGWNWQTDLQQRPARDIPTRAKWEALLSRSGIAPHTRVILYGDNHNWFASYAYWLFRLYGHREAHLLNGGRARWIDEGRAVTSALPRREPTAYAAAEPEPPLQSGLGMAARHHLEHRPQHPPPGRGLPGGLRKRADADVERRRWLHHRLHRNLAAFPPLRFPQGYEARPAA